MMVIIPKGWALYFLCVPQPLENLISKKKKLWILCTNENIRSYNFEFQ